MTAGGGVGVCAVLESCRDRDGLLNDTGRCIEWAQRKEREWRQHGMTECADEAKAYAQSLAFNYKAAADSLRGSCRVPLIARYKRTARRASALAALEPQATNGAPNEKA